MIRLANPFLEFAFDPNYNGWNLYARRDELGLEWAQTQAYYSASLPVGRPSLALGEWDTALAEETFTPVSPHGPLRQVRLTFPAANDGVQARIEFALPEALPALFWRLHLSNDGPQPVYPGRLTLLEIDPLTLAGLGAKAQGRADQPRVLGIDPAAARIFSNGWQSWNFTGAYGHGERYRRTRLRFLSEPMRVSQGIPHPRLPGHFTSDFFGVLAPRAGQYGWLAGFLSQRQQFGSLDVRLIGAQPALHLWANGDHARLDPGQSLHTDWACLFLLTLTDLDPLGPYLEAVGRENGGGADPDDGSHTAGGDPKIIRPPSSGWSSWYYYYRHLTAEAVRRNLQHAAQHRAELPLDLIQIDDGFMPYAGDWDRFTPGFPDGVAPLAQEIRAAGFTPGLWLAPFIVDRRSALAQRRPEWLVRGGWRGRSSNAGFLHNRLAAGLDLTHPGALEFAAQVVGTAVHRWGFPFLKLDFLYAGALPGRRFDPTRSRAQALRAGLEALRQAAGDEVYLLGCGCPLGSAVGLVDAMRISADVDSHWFPTFTGRGLFFRPEPDMPSARNAIQNSLTRAPLHRRWWINDPDCLLLRHTTHLSLEETHSLATVIALSQGLLLNSDDLAGLSAERIDLLRALLPPIPALMGEGSAPRPWILDWLDAATPRRVRLDLHGPVGTWRLLARFNWDDHPRDLLLRAADFKLPAGAYWMREFWSDQLRLLPTGEWTFPAVLPHGCRLVALRACDPSTPQYLGSNLHISQGLEVSAWDWDASQRSLAFLIRRPGPAHGHVDLALPGSIQEAQVDGRPATWEKRSEGPVRLFVDLVDSLEVQIQLSP